MSLDQKIREASQIIRNFVGGAAKVIKGRDSIYGRYPKRNTKLVNIEEDTPPTSYDRTPADFSVVCRCGIRSTFKREDSKLSDPPNSFDGREARSTFVCEGCLDLYYIVRAHNPWDSVRIKIK